MSICTAIYIGILVCALKLVFLASQWLTILKLIKFPASYLSSTKFLKSIRRSELDIEGRVI
jgi:hypothetical protein